MSGITVALILLMGYIAVYGIIDRICKACETSNMYKALGQACSGNNGTFTPTDFFKKMNAAAAVADKSINGGNNESNNKTTM